MPLSGFAAAALARATSARMLSDFRNGLFFALLRASSARMSSDFGAAGLGEADSGALGLGSTLAVSVALPSAVTARGGKASGTGAIEGASPIDVSVASILVGSILRDSSLAMACGSRWKNSSIGNLQKLPSGYRLLAAPPQVFINVAGIHYRCAPRRSLMPARAQAGSSRHRQAAAAWS